MIWTGIILAFGAVFFYLLRERASDRDSEKVLNFMFKLVLSGAIACIGLGIIFLYLANLGVDVDRYKGLIILAIGAIFLANMKN